MVVLRRIFLLLVLLLVVIQIVQPERTNPSVDPKHEVTAILPVEAPVAASLQRSCYDCHSNRTVWPSYSNVAPASWLVARDVRQGRKAMNFSEWGSYTSEKSQELLNTICKEVSEGEMPGLPYTLLHPRSRLNSKDVQQVCSWTEGAVLTDTQASQPNAAAHF